ncbi:hypothetical protein L211DRAFT_885467, partial [Terfezia boudieri ATCC MYA-4762]
LYKKWKSKPRKETLKGRGGVNEIKAKYRNYVLHTPFTFFSSVYFLCPSDPCPCDPCQSFLFCHLCLKSLLPFSLFAAIFTFATSMAPFTSCFFTSTSTPTPTFSFSSSAVSSTFQFSRSTFIFVAPSDVINQPTMPRAKIANRQSTIVSSIFLYEYNPLTIGLFSLPPVILGDGAVGEEVGVVVIVMAGAVGVLGRFR